MVGERAGYLLHPRGAGLGVDASDLYTARLQLDHEEDEIPLETGEREHFNRKEVGSCEAIPLREQTVTNCSDRLTVLVGFAAILMEPSRADRAEIVRTKGPMAVHPDHDCGHSRQPEEVNHEAPSCGPAGVF